jgi:hypothetical protein
VLLAKYAADFDWRGPSGVLARFGLGGDMEVKIIKEKHTCKLRISQQETIGRQIN